MYSILGAIVAVAVFVVSWFLGGLAMKFVDDLRGLGDSVLQGLFREFLVPGVAAYFGNWLAATLVPKSSASHVFYAFSVMVVAALSFFVATYVLLADAIDPVATQIAIMLSLTVPAGLVGAYIYARPRL